MECKIHSCYKIFNSNGQWHLQNKKHSKYDLQMSRRVEKNLKTAKKDKHKKVQAKILACLITNKRNK